MAEEKTMKLKVAKPLLFMKPLFAVFLALTPLAAVAQPFPSKPIRIIVPFTPGSATDTMARPVADKLQQALGQSVIVENRPGAGGTIGAAALAKSPADGYTLIVVSTGHVVNHVLYANLPYDTLKDFAGVAPLAGLPSVLVVSPALGVRSARELVAMAKAKPGQLNYATAGIGSGAHISSEKFRMAAGIDAVHVPLKGSPESLTETMGGRTQFTWTPISTAAGQIRGGSLLALAVSTPQRSAAFPEVPTIAEAGYPRGEFNFWVGLLAPAGTPREVLARLNAEVGRALQSPDMKERLAKLGAEPMAMSPERFDAFIREEYATLGEVMRAAGVKAQ
jgi:tripartite-type tricarboxylate transporter receptor subunit TctC